MKKELEQFNINIDDIKQNNDLYDNIHEAINRMNLYTLSNRYEIILNNNLIETEEIKTGMRTIFGCRISYDNLPKDISFIIRQDKEPSYEELQKRINKVIEYINDYENYCMEISHNIIAILKGEDKE